MTDATRLALMIGAGQILMYILLSLPGILRREKPEPIAASPAWGIVIGPSLEELLFRGIPLFLYIRWPTLGLLAAGVSLFLFVVGHIYQWKSGDMATNVVNLLWKLIVGGCWMWVTLASGSIAWAILLHAFNNTAGYAIWYIMRRRHDVGV